MWTVVYVSRNKEKVEKLVEILNTCDIMTMLRPASGEGCESGTYEILVPKTELETAQDIIFDTELSGK